MFDGLLVLTDLVNGGGDFPVERTADVEEEENEENDYYYAERNPSCRRRHSLCVSGLAPFGFCVSGLNGVADFETREESVYDTRRIGHRQVNV